jgi:anti-sigma-K factor RskA
MNTMKPVRSVLEDADPLRVEPELSGDDARRMRQVILSATGQIDTAGAFWRRAVAVAAVLVLMAVAGTIGLRTPTRAPKVAGNNTSVEPAEAGERLQVQFATPGGTRVIWTLSSDFALREVAR